MKKELKDLLCLVSVSLILFACSKDNGGGGSNSNGNGNNYPTYTESEQLDDLLKVDEAEQSLEKLGLKFDKNEEYRNGLVKTTYFFDKNYLSKKFSGQHVDVNMDDICAAVENYIRVAESHVNKYSGPFNLKMNSGQTIVKEMTREYAESLQDKISLSKKLLVSVRPKVNNITGVDTGI